MPTIASLNVNLTAGIGDFSAKMNSAARAVEQLRSRVSSAMGGISSALASAGASVSAFAAAAKGIKEAVNFEQTTIAFEVMLKSADKARLLIGKLQKFADITPFSTEEVVKAGKQLLAYQFSVEELIPSLTTLGNVASGLGVPLDLLIYQYGTLRAQGRAFAKDINQFTSAGVPIIAALAQTMGVAETEVHKLVESGKVGFAQVEQAFRSMTAAGGQFSNLMARQSQTVGGLFSTMASYVTQSLRGIATEAIEAFKIKPAIANSATFFQSFSKNVVPKIGTAFRSVTQFISENAKTFERLRTVLVVVTAAFVTYRTNMIATSVALGIVSLATKGLTLAVSALTIAINILKTTIQALRAVVIVTTVVLGALTAPITAIPVLLGTATIAIVAIAASMTNWRWVIVKVAGTIKNVLGSAVDAMTKQIDGMMANIEQAIMKAQDLVNADMQPHGPEFKFGKPGILEQFGAPQPAPLLGREMPSILDRFGVKIRQLPNFMDELAKLREARKNVEKGAGRLPDRFQFGSVAKNLSPLGGLQQMGQAVQGILGNALGQALLQNAKNFFDKRNDAPDVRSGQLITAGSREAFTIGQGNRKNKTEDKTEENTRKTYLEIVKLANQISKGLKIDIQNIEAFSQ